MKRWGMWVTMLALLAGAAVAYAATRSPEQPEVDAADLPVVAMAHKTGVYFDCSKVNDVAYFPDNPCQTFVLLQNGRLGSADQFWNAETRRMSMSGWHHSAAQLVDYDGLGAHMASVGDSWVSPDHRACAYIATVRRGVAAEARELFPYDPNDIPRGVYEFYRRAKRAISRQALWVRLRPPNRGGHCIG